MKKKLLKIFFSIPLIGLTFFSISCEKEVFTGLVEDQLFDSGKLIITSQPVGFTIFVDKKNMDLKTPDTITNLTPGTRTITLKHELWADTSISVNMENDQTKYLNVDVLSNINSYGWLSCSSNPSGAQIYLNDKITNDKTPAVIKGLLPASYKVKVTFKEHRADSAIIKVKGKQYTYYNTKLEDTSKIVYYMQKNSSIASDGLTALCVDRKNAKWFASIDKGVLKFDGTNWTQVNITAGVPSSHITALHYDSYRDQIWMGTASGLAMFNGVTWIDMSSRVASNYVTSIIQDHSNNVWIGTMNGLYKYDGSSWKIFTMFNSGLKINQITCLAEAPDGNLWIGTTFGTHRFGNNTWDFHPVNSMDLDEKLGVYIQAIAVDKEGWIWVYHAGDPSAGTFSEILLYKDNQWSYFRGLPVSYQPSIKSFLVDESGNIWMAATNGLTRYSKTKGALTFTANSTNLSSNECYSVRIDLNGDAWIATMGGGAVKLKKGNF